MKNYAARIEPAATETPLEARPARALRILLAEDNSVNRRIATRMLEKQDHTVIGAANGREAVAAILDQCELPFDLILMDVQMPEMDGLEAATLIRQWEKESGGHIPIVALTAHAMMGDKASCLQAGMDSYVAKPFQSEDLIGAIESLMALQATI